MTGTAASGTDASGTATPGTAVTVTAARPSRIRPLLNGALLVALLAVAAVVLHTTPTDDEWQGPIPVYGAIGETVAGRNIEATVTDVRIADAVTASNGWAGPTTGIWVVVDASVAAVEDDRAALLGTANLLIGGTTYSASQRPDLATIAGSSLSTGIPYAGPLMFEVPRDAVDSAAARDAELNFAVSNDPRTDSLLVIPVDLTAIDHEDTIETTEPRVVAR